jgi:hypothetical protein
LRQNVFGESGAGARLPPRSASCRYPIPARASEAAFGVADPPDVEEGDEEGDDEEKDESRVEVHDVG